MLRWPELIFDVLNVAVSPDRVAFPSVVVPFLKVTVPEGVPPNAGTTFAVNFTV
jgi:hypothetical protein